jgi:hypothetical protein
MSTEKSLNALLILSPAFCFTLDSLMKKEELKKDLDKLWNLVLSLINSNTKVKITKKKRQK